MKYSILACLIVLMIGTIGFGRVGNVTYSVFYGVDPIDYFPKAILYHMSDGKHVSVQLPSENHYEIVSRYNASMPGWSADVNDSNDVVVYSPEGLQYVHPNDMDHRLSVIKDVTDANYIIFDYNATDANLIDNIIDGYDPNYYLAFDYNEVGGEQQLYIVTAWAYDANRAYTLEYDVDGRLEYVSGCGSCSSCGGDGELIYDYNSTTGKLDKIWDANEDLVYAYAYDANGRLTDKYFGSADSNDHILKNIYSTDSNGTDLIDTYDYVDANNYRTTREYSSGDIDVTIKFDELNDDPNDPNGNSFAEYTVNYHNSNGCKTKMVKIPASAYSDMPDTNSLSGIRKEYTYDPNTGELLTEKWFDVNDVNFTVASYIYDYVLTDDNDILSARVLTYTDARNSVTNYIYDGNDTDPNTRSMPEVTTGISGTKQLKYNYTYDNFNRVVVERQLDDSNNLIVQTKYEYDSWANLVKRWDDFGDSNELTEYEYNGFNEMITMTSSSGVIQGRSYYDTGNVEYEVVYYPSDPNYVYSQTKYSYDINGRVEQVARAVDDDVFLVDSPNSWIYTQYEYDLRGNKTKVIEDVNGLELETVYEYNNQNEVTKVTLPGGKWTKTTRDGRGLVIKTEVGYDSTTVATTTFEYDANGNLVWKTDPDGYKSRYDYDDFDRVIMVTRGL